MSILRFILGILAGLFSITLVTELIEFTTVKLLSGYSIDYLYKNRDIYFEIRNQVSLLLFKMVYNFIAAVIGGFLTAWISDRYARTAVYGLIIIQTASLIWGGFFSELSATGPTWMWIALILITPVGIYLGYIYRLKQADLKNH